MQRTVEYVQASQRRFERTTQELQMLRRENQRLRELVSSLQGAPPEPYTLDCTCGAACWAGVGGACTRVRAAVTGPLTLQRSTAGSVLHVPAAVADVGVGNDALSDDDAQLLAVGAAAAAGHGVGHETGSVVTASPEVGIGTTTSHSPPSAGDGTGNPDTDAYYYGDGPDGLGAHAAGGVDGLGPDGLQAYAMDGGVGGSDVSGYLTDGNDPDGLGIMVGRDHGHLSVHLQQAHHRTARERKRGRTSAGGGGARARAHAAVDAVRAAGRSPLGPADKKSA